MIKVIKGVKRYPFSYIKHDHKISTYMAECDIAMWDAEKAGNEDMAEEYRQRKEKAAELDMECHRYIDGRGVTWLSGPSVALANDIVGGYNLKGDLQGFWRTDTDALDDDEYDDDCIGYDYGW